MFTRWKSPARHRVPSILSPLDHHISPFFDTLTHPSHAFIAETVASFTTPRSSNGRMFFFSNTLAKFLLSSYNTERKPCPGGLVRVGGFRVGGCGGSWNGIESGFIDDEEFDGLRDARCAPPTVHLKKLAVRKRWLPAIDSLVTRDDDFVPIHRYKCLQNSCARRSSSKL